MDIFLLLQFTFAHFLCTGLGTWIFCSWDTHINDLLLQLPGLICPGITLVISPLVSLIQDQIMHLLQVMMVETIITSSVSKKLYFNAVFSWYVHIAG